MNNSGRKIGSRLVDLGHALPPAPAPNGRYVTCMIEGNRLSTSGQLSRGPNGVIQGPIESATDLARAQQAAEICVLRGLSAVHNALGSFDRLAGVSAMRGYIFATPSFTEHSLVLDAASELILALFGEAGQHIRTAIGVSSLPAGGLVELDMEFRLLD